MTADWAAGVQHLAAEEQAGMPPALQRAGVHLVQRHAAAGDLGLAIAFVTVPRQHIGGQVLDQPLTFLALQLRRLPIRRHAGLQHHLRAEALRDDAPDCCRDEVAGAGECLANVDYNISSSDTNRAQPVIFAIHGGLIEDGTAQLADHLVAQLGWDHYIFRARAVSATCKETRWMHVTSGRFNSATARALAFSHPSAVSLHGYNENSAERANWPQNTWFICTGGDHATARALFTSSVNTPAFSIDGRRVRAATCDGIEGTGDTNVVNLPPNHGLQIELPRHLRLSSSATLRTRLTRAIDAAL